MPRKRSTCANDPAWAYMFTDESYAADVAFTGEFASLFHDMMWQKRHQLDLNDLWWMEYSQREWVNPAAPGYAHQLFFGMRDFFVEPVALIAQLRRENDIKRQWLDTREWSTWEIAARARYLLNVLLWHQGCALCGKRHETKAAWRHANSYTHEKD